VFTGIYSWLPLWGRVILAHQMKADWCMFVVTGLMKLQSADEHEKRKPRLTCRWWIYHCNVMQQVLSVGFTTWPHWWRSIPPQAISRTGHKLTWATLEHVYSGGKVELAFAVTAKNKTVEVSRTNTERKWCHCCHLSLLLIDSHFLSFLLLLH